MNDRNPRLTFALPKGRLLEPAVEFLRSIGYASPCLEQMGRHLLLEDEERSLRYLLVRPSDVVTYVAEGAADLGIVGKDVLLEENRPVYEVMDLGFGACHLAVAAPRDRWQGYATPAEFFRSCTPKLRVATKYPAVAARHFAEQNLSIHSIPLRGSVELAPLVDLADVIVDLVSTGRTLLANDMVELERVAEVTARLTVNPVSLRVKPRIAELLARLRRDQLVARGEGDSC